MKAKGGAAGDYVIWSTDAQGVQRVYPYVNSGNSNTIDVFVEATTQDSFDGRGTPTQQILDDVAAVLEQDPNTSLPLTERGRRPLTVTQINTLPISVRLVDVI